MAAITLTSARRLRNSQSRIVFNRAFARFPNYRYVFFQCIYVKNQQQSFLNFFCEHGQAVMMFLVFTDFAE